MQSGRDLFIKETDILITDAFDVLKKNKDMAFALAS